MSFWRKLLMIFCVMVLIIVTSAVTIKITNDIKIKKELEQYAPDDIGKIKIFA